MSPRTSNCKSLHRKEGPAKESEKDPSLKAGGDQQRVEDFVLKLPANPCTYSQLSNANICMYLEDHKGVGEGLERTSRDLFKSLSSCCE